VALIFTRQNVPVLDPEKYPIKEGVDSEGKPDLIIIATGSEVHLALKGKEELEKEGIKVRVVSMPSWELFEEQTEEYKNSVLIPDIPKLAIEAGVTTGWQKYVGANGDIIGIDRFGESAPGNVVMEKFGFNVENVVNRAKLLLK